MLERLLAQYLTSSGVLFLFLFTACSSSTNETPLVVEDEFALSSFREPSGIVYCMDTNSLFIVGDEGDLGEVSLNGSLLRQQRIIDASFEGITYNPQNGLLYLVIEGDDSVIAIDPESFEVLNNYEVERVFENRLVLEQNRHGLEGITYVPDSSHPDGGSLFIANQVRDRENTLDVSGIFELETPTADNTKLFILNIFESSSLDLAGLFFNQIDNHFYLVSDDEDRLIKLDRNGQLVNSFYLPGKTQEGITFDADGFIYIAQDAGGVLKLSLKLN